MKKLVLALTFLLLAPIAQAFADIALPPKEPAPPPPVADKEGFVPVKEGEVLGPGETLPATGLVAGAYGFILAAIVVWVASVAVRARRVEEDVSALRAKIDRAA